MVAIPAGRQNRLEERTRFVDAEVARAIGRGVGQLVLLGAGYDGRALRFGGETTRWFEVDHPATLRDKRRRLSALGTDPADVSYVGVDLASDDLGAALGAAGHDAGRPSLFVAETLFTRLTLEAAAAVCSSVRARAAAGSTLAVTFLVAADRGGGAGAAHDAVDALDRVMRAVRAPWQHEYGPGDAEKLLVVTAWRVVRSSATGRPGWGSRLLALAGEPEPDPGPDRGAAS